MPKLSLNNIASGFATNSALNANFDAIEAAVENTLSRDGSTPNHMLSSLDMNSHSIHNLGRATTASSALSLGQFLEYANTVEDLTGVVPLTWEFTATGENSYSLPLLSTNKVDMYIISVDGLVLSPTTYTVNVDSQTIIFTDAPAEGSSLVIRLFGKIPEATSTSVSFTGIRQTFPFDVVTDETTFVTTVTLDSNTDVYLNGVKLIINVDYTISGTSVILTSTAVIGDVVEVVTHSAAVVPSAVLQDVIDATADAEALLLEVDTAIAESLSDVTATATTLAAGEPATASFDVDTKVLTVGVPVGATGAAGAAGSAGVGVASGGTTGQILRKISSTDYDAGWSNTLTSPSITGNTIASGSITINTPSSFGYATGAGGFVIQTTSKNTDVTLNKPCGNIGMFTASMAAGEVASFIFNNSFIGYQDILLIRPSDSLFYFDYRYVCQNGYAEIYVKNVSGITTSNPTGFYFAIIKVAQN